MIVINKHNRFWLKDKELLQARLQLSPATVYKALRGGPVGGRVVENAIAVSGQSFEELFDIMDNTLAGVPVTQGQAATDTWPMTWDEAENAGIQPIVNPHPDAMGEKMMCVSGVYWIAADGALWFEDATHPRSVRAAKALFDVTPDANTTILNTDIAERIKNNDDEDV